MKMQESNTFVHTPSIRVKRSVPKNCCKHNNHNFIVLYF